MTEFIAWWELPGAAGESRTKEQYERMVREAKEPNPDRTKKTAVRAGAAIQRGIDGGDIDIAIMHVCDLIAGNPRAVIDQRAWQHLAAYMPIEVLVARLEDKLKKMDAEDDDGGASIQAAFDADNGGRP